MPELPEVETVRRTLVPAIGATIAGVWDSGKGLHMFRKPPRAKLKLLIGSTITALRRHGKYLLVDTDGPRTLLVHLGMTGRFLIVPASAPRAKHTHVVLELGTRELRFVDPRRFGQIDVIERAREREHEGLALLGPDPLADGVSAEHLYRRSRKKRAMLKAFILDQSVLAGIGNIYASEALWRAQLRPTKRARTLTVVASNRLAAAIREVIDHALTNGGTSLRDFRRGRWCRGRECRVFVGLRARRRAVPTLQNEDSPLDPPRKSDLLLSNVPDPVSGLRVGR